MTQGHIREEALREYTIILNPIVYKKNKNGGMHLTHDITKCMTVVLISTSAIHKTCLQK